MLGETLEKHRFPEIKHRSVQGKSGMSWLLSGFVKITEKRTLVAGRQIFKPFPKEIQPNQTIKLNEYVHHAVSWIPLDQLV